MPADKTSEGFYKHSLKLVLIASRDCCPFQFHFEVEADGGDVYLANTFKPQNLTKALPNCASEHKFSDFCDMVYIAVHYDSVVKLSNTH